MLWWQWLITFGAPALGVVLGLVLGGILTSNYKKTPTKWHPWSFPTWEKRHGYNCITFDQFLDMYSINPNKWCTQIEASYTSDGVWDKAVYRMPGCLNDISLFWATLRDKRRYKKWWLEQRKAYNHRIKAAEYKVVLEDVQKDIQIKMKEAERERKKEQERIEAERRRHQEEYECLITNMEKLARSTKIRINDVFAATVPMTEIKYKTETISPKVDNKIYIKNSQRHLLHNCDTKIMYYGDECEYFEADCGIPYLRRIKDGKIFEVAFEE